MLATNWSGNLSGKHLSRSKDEVIFFLQKENRQDTDIDWIIAVLAFGLYVQHDKIQTKPPGPTQPSQLRYASSSQ